MRIAGHPRRRAGPHRPAVDGAQRHPPGRPRARRAIAASRALSRSSRAASSARRSRPCCIDGGVAANVVPDRCRVTDQPPLRPRPHAGRGRGPRPRACWRAVARRPGDALRGRRRGRRRPRPALSHPLVAALVDRNELDRGRQAGLDRRGPVRRARASRRPTSDPVTRPSPTPPASSCTGADLDAVLRGPRRSGAPGRRSVGSSVDSLRHPGREPRGSPDHAEEHSMAIEIGQTAPEFSLKDQSGETVQPVGLRRHARRWPWCSTRSPSPGCARASCASCATTTPSSPTPACRCWPARATAAFAQKQWASQQGYQFPVLSDFWPHGEVAKAYGVFNEALGLRQPGHLRHRQGRHRGRHLPDPDLGHRPRGEPLRPRR